MNKGKLIAFEGGEGAGKSTQINFLLDFLKTKINNVHLTREPGGCDISEKIRTLLVSGKVEDLDEISEFLLFSTSRHELVRQKIKPALDNGDWVISDRFYLSSYVYQSYAGGLDFDFVKNVTEKAVGSVKPDITILLDVDPKEGIKRSLNNTITEDEKRFESKALQYHQKAREGFLKFAKEDDSVIVIDGSKDICEVSDDIMTALKERHII